MRTGWFKSDSLTYNTLKYIHEGSQELVMSRLPDLWTNPILGSNCAWIRLKAKNSQEQLVILRNVGTVLLHLHPFCCCFKDFIYLF